MEFPLTFLVGTGFSWQTVFTYFWVKNPRDCTKSLVAEDLPMGQLGGQASIFFLLLFIYLYLFICYLFIVCVFSLMQLFFRPSINYML